jgi:hypothetical protein
MREKHKEHPQDLQNSSKPKRVNKKKNSKKNPYGKKPTKDVKERNGGDKALLFPVACENGDPQGSI